MQNRTEAIWGAFGAQIRSFIHRRISDSLDVDDILQEVFLKIHSNIGALNDETKIRSWVYQIARNTIIDYYRKRREKTEDIDTIQIAEEIDEEGPAREIASGLKEMVEDLPEIYAQALILVEFEGLSQYDLSQKLGISVSGAKSRVQRARQLLKDALMRCCHFQFDRYGTIIDCHPAACCCCN
jgi:RNA polymerase sigma-70 factor (ECF subfamily)